MEDARSDTPYEAVRFTYARFVSLGLIAILIIIVLSARWLAPRKPRIDWRRLTIRGFGVGTTFEKLSKTLGSPTSEKPGVYLWLKDNLDLRFWQEENEIHLGGPTLELDGRVIATGDVGPAHEDQLRTFGRNIQQLLGPGADIVDSKHLNEPVGFFYADSAEADHKKLEVRVDEITDEWVEAGNKRVYYFEWSWAGRLHPRARMKGST